MSTKSFYGSVFMAFGLLASVPVCAMEEDTQSNHNEVFDALNERLDFSPRSVWGSQGSSSPSSPSELLALNKINTFKKGDRKQYTEFGKSYPIALTDQENFALAVGSGDLPTVQILLKTNKSININGLHKNGKHVAFYPLLNGNAPMVKVLIEHGANLSYVSEYGQILFNNAVWKDRTEVVPFLLAIGADPGMRDDLGKSALHIAAGRGNFALVKMLVEHNPSLKDDPDHNGLTPLMYAAWSGNTSILSYLIKMGASVHRVDHQGKSPLSAAAGKGHLDCVREILNSTNKHITLNYGDLNGSTPLHWASFNGHVAVVNELVNAGAEIDVKDYRGITPLSYAVQNSAHAVIRLLLNFGANASLFNKDNMTPLHWAAINGDAYSAQLLLDKGAKINNYENKKKKTPLHLVVKSLLKRGSNKDKTGSPITVEQAISFIETLVRHTSVNKKFYDSFDMTPLQTFEYLASKEDRETSWYQTIKNLLS